MKLPELLQSTQSTMKFTDACKTKHVSYTRLEDINHAMESQRHYFAKKKKKIIASNGNFIIILN